MNKDGFTLDTGIFADILDDCDSEEDVEYERCKLLSNQEMLKYLYLEDSENENRDNKEEHTVNSVVTSFSELKPKMHNIYEDGKVRTFFSSNHNTTWDFNQCKFIRY